MTRKEELVNLIGQDNASLLPVVDDMVFLEKQLEQLRALPMIKVHPNDPARQKVTPSAKLYKECLQQYTNIVKILLKATGTDVDDEDSPLRKWSREHIEE